MSNWWVGALLGILAWELAKFGYRWYTQSKMLTVLVREDELHDKLMAIAKYKGFTSAGGLNDAEVDVRAHFVDPYGGDARLSFLIYFPKHVLTNARYEESKKRIEDILNYKED